MRARIQSAIDRKVEGEEISVSETTPTGNAKVIDLMDALRASLEKTEGARASAARLGPRKAPKKMEQAAKPSRKARG